MKEKSFEEQLENLEKIVLELESGNVNLDDAINKYTEAMKIAKACSLKLSAVEEQIAKIVSENNTVSELEVE